MSPLAAVAYTWTAIAIAAGFVLLRRPAPYGRHRTAGWGPEVSDRVGWIVMESVSPVALVAGVGLADGSLSTGAGILAGCWIAHYVHRAVIYPVRSRRRGRMPIAVMASAVLFNAVNGTINGLALVTWPPGGVTLGLGIGIWAVGLGVNLHADETLRRIRLARPGAYDVPGGGLYRWVSCPNYLGEIVEWSGFALAAWNPAALSFAVWTVANLVPRALSHHAWYRECFPEYPGQRRALIPGLL